jgi:23S rRNA pseudouridine2605 synthase
VCRELGYDVGPDDVVEAGGRVLQPSGRSVYIALNKPKGFITTANDDRGRPTVLDLVRDVDGRVFPVGRLDASTTGLLLMTNDGDFAFHITHPGHSVRKTYRARVAGILSDKRLALLRGGVDIGGYVTAPAEVTVVKQAAKSAICDITISEGKNRQVRKMFAAVGSKVLDLERTAISTPRGVVLLGGLMPGHYRKLKRDELLALGFGR